MYKIFYEKNFKREVNFAVLTLIVCDSVDSENRRGTGAVSLGSD